MTQAIPWRVKYHAWRERHNPHYHGLNFKDRLKAEFAYDYGKHNFGVTDDLGHILEHGSPEYGKSKEAMRENGARIARGLPLRIE